MSVSACAPLAPGAPTAVLARLRAESYRAHALHAPERLWVEKNCYVDVWIELLAALGLEPCAMLGFTVALDCQADQWSFFKPSGEELRELYGLEVQELYVWRELAEHALAQLARGRFLCTEADAFWLPDAAGTDYRRRHTKTTIAINAIDPGGRRLGYFHNAGYHELEGEDFEALLGERPAGCTAAAGALPLYAEVIRCERLERRAPESLRAQARALLARHLQRLPAGNPVLELASQLRLHWPRLCERGLDAFHAWAFGTLRQLGAAAELSCLHLRWLEPGPGGPFEPAARGYLELSQLCQTLILKGARAARARRDPDAGQLLAQMARAWEQASSALVSAAL